MNPVYTTKSSFLKIPFNIILPSTPKSSEWLLPFRLSNNFVRISHLPHARYMPRPTHPPWSDHPNTIWWRVQIMALLIMQFSPASRHFIPLRSKYFPKHMLSNTLHVCSYLDVRDPVSHPYKTTGRITVLYILIFTFSDTDGKAKDSELCGSKHSPNFIYSYFPRECNFYLLTSFSNIWNLPNFQRFY
jgi:hypothetical protein